MLGHIFFIQDAGSDLGRVVSLMFVFIDSPSIRHVEWLIKQPLFHLAQSNTQSVQITPNQWRVVLAQRMDSLQHCQPLTNDM